LIQLAKTDDEIKPLLKIHRANPEMSAYECRRKLNIINNEKLLKSLGISSGKKSIKVKAKKPSVYRHPFLNNTSEDYEPSYLETKFQAPKRKRKSNRLPTESKRVKYEREDVEEKIEKPTVPFKGNQWTQRQLKGRLL